MLYHLKPHADQIIVVSPMDRVNKTYSSGMVPLPLIHYKLTDKLLDEIWDRQEVLSNVFKRANNPAIIKELFDKLNIRPAQELIQHIYAKKACEEELLSNAIDDEEGVKKSIEEINEQSRSLVIMIYKHFINENFDKYAKMTLTKTEQYTLKYLNLNPNLVFVLDDCTTQIAKLKKHRRFQEIFYMGRHANITLIIGCHTDKTLDPEIKKNVSVSIYTDEGTARAVIERESTALDKEGKVVSRAAIRAAFVSTKKHQKLAYITSQSKWFKTTATKRVGFSFGSPIIQEFCARIQISTQSVSTDNKFMAKFV